MVQIKKKKKKKKKNKSNYGKSIVLEERIKYLNNQDFFKDKIKSIINCL
jgi:hypothetical protein